jgi:pyrroline-5-carboxylate reductase
VKIAFLGGGKMAEAILASLLTSRTVSPSACFISDISEERLRLLKKRFGVNTYKNNVDAVLPAKVVFLAVKPQQLDELLEEIKDSVTDEHIIVSIAAGKTLSYFSEKLGRGKLVRVMPNMGCMVGEAMSAICADESVSPRDVAEVERLLQAAGKTLQLTEDKFDAVTALSGSGPAFFAYVLDSMVSGAIAEGLDRDQALLLAEQTMLGTARLLLDNKVDPADLIRDVASARGTTAEGLNELEASDLRLVLQKTIAAAARRSRELSM